MPPLVRAARQIVALDAAYSVAWDRMPWNSSPVSSELKVVFWLIALVSPSGRISIPSLEKEISARRDEVGLSKSVAKDVALQVELPGGERNNSP